MAGQVVDILHELTFEANTDVLEAVNKEFGTQLKQMQDLKAKELEYQQLLEKTAQDDIKNRKIIEGLLNKNKQQYDAIAVSVGRQIVNNDKLNQSLQHTGRNVAGLQHGFSQLLREAPAFAFSAQTGLLALSNNIPMFVEQLEKANQEGASTSDILKDIGDATFSITGLITIATAAFTIFGDEIFAAGESAEEAEDKMQNLIKSLDDYIKRIKEINAIQRSNQFGLTIGPASEAQLQRELEVLKARGASADAIAAKENEISLAKQQSLNFLKSELQTALDYIKAVKDAQLSGETIPGLPALSPDIRKVIRDLKPLDAEREIRRRFDEINNEIANEENDREVIRVTRLRERAEERQKLREKELKDNEEYIKKLKSQFDDLAGLKLEELDLTDVTETPERIEGADAELKYVNDTIKKGFQLEDEKAKRSKQVIKESLDYAFNTTVSTLQSIYEAQLYYLDAEINARRERVDQAKELAEKGNTEILESELNRLRETEAERERVAQKQLQLNALLQASSAAIAATQALQVVTNAGATGDPYSTAARIAAAVAALAAGFAFVTNLTQAAQAGFKDGVIGLDGPGTGTSDSIPARLSRGESVMTAAETNKYRPFLEAMRDGTFDSMIAHTATPVIVGAANDYSKLEKKLDGVIDAIGMSGTNVNARVDERGISILTEKYSRYERNRWR